MTNWYEVIEANWNACIEAMDKAAHDVGESDGGNILRVELADDGTVSSYWTLPEIISAEVKNGKALLIWNYIGGEAWTPEWADTYDATPDLEARQAQTKENA